MCVKTEYVLCRLHVKTSSTQTRVRLRAYAYYYMDCIYYLYPKLLNTAESLYRLSELEVALALLVACSIVDNQSAQQQALLIITRGTLTTYYVLR